MACTWVHSRLVSMMTSSCPRSTWLSFAASTLGATRRVASWTSVPRMASVICNADHGGHTGTGTGTGRTAGAGGPR